jgi:hypothetical protein
MSNAHRLALAAVIKSGPTSAIHRVFQWRLVDLCHSRAEISGQDCHADHEPAATKGIDAANIEYWLSDETRVGQRNKFTRRWAMRGKRRWVPYDQRTASACIFVAISPKHGQAASLVLPHCNAVAMSFTCPRSRS